MSDQEALDSQHEAVPTRSVIKTMQLLEQLSRDGESSLGEIAGRLGMHKSTVHRFVNSLKELGYVRQNPENERYSLTLKLFEVGSAVLERTELWKEAHPIMKTLAEQTLETVHLAALENDELVYLHKIESTRALRVSMNTRVGRTAPLHCTSLGKVLLGSLSDRKRERLMKKVRYDRYTEHTRTEPESLSEELEKVAKRGYAVDNEEHELGVRCVGAPIRNAVGDVVAALSVSMPSVRLNDENMGTYTELVVRSAQNISYKLGWRSPTT